MIDHAKISRWVLGALLVAVTSLYLITLDNGLRPDELTGGDLITHQYAQVEGRPGNAPGYPLYTLGGWLWFRLGRALLGWVLNPIQILSLYSTLWGLAALAVLYLILRRVNSRWGVAVLLTAFFAVTYFFWYYSVTTEQYTSAVFQTLLVIWLAFRWEEQPRDSTLLGLAFVSGTMLANMVTTLFILPPLLGFIFSRRALGYYFKRPGFVARAIGLALLPPVSYTYIFIRGAQHPEWRGQGEWPSTWAWFIDFLTIQQGRDELAPGFTVQNFFTGEFPGLIWHELTWPIFLGGLIGLGLLGRRRAIFLYSTLVIYFFFCWLYRFGNWFQVIIPAYSLFIIGTAALMERLGDWEIGRLGDWFKVRSQGPASCQFSAADDRHAPFTIHYSLFTIFLLSLLIYRFWTNFPRANQHNLPADTGLDPGWALVADQPHPPARLIVDFEEEVALQYLQTVWGVGPAPVQIVGPANLEEIIEAGSGSRLTYISRRGVAAAAAERRLAGLHPQAAGQQLIALPAAPRTNLPAALITPVNLNFGDHLKLAGWERIKNDFPLPEMAAKRGVRANWAIALYWQASEALTEDYTVSVRPLARGQPISAAEGNLIQDHRPVWGVYPTGRWQPGEIVRDVYALNMPAGIEPDAVQIVVYRATDEGFENLAEQVIEIQ